MKCPFCGKSGTRVHDTRTVEQSSVVLRRRGCAGCGGKFTTYERVESQPLTIIKSDSKREAFDRAKLLRGLKLACMKRPIPEDALERLVNDIEHRLRDYIMEVPSKLIGEMALEKLRKLDEVAYVRFASIYRKFDDVDAFLKELRTIRNARSSSSKAPRRHSKGS